MVLVDGGSILVMPRSVMVVFCKQADGSVGLTMLRANPVD
jgi:hypothetical protein